VTRELLALGHDVRQVPPVYAKPFRQTHKNDFRDAHAIAEAVQRPTTRCVAPKTDEQLDLQALHRVRYRLVGQRTAIINQIRCLEHGITVRQRLHWLRHALPNILAQRTDVLSPRMVRILEDLAQDWRHLDDRIETVSGEIEALSKNTEPCRHLMTIPGIGPIISSAVVAAIGNGTAFTRGRDFAAWLGLVPKQISTGIERSSGVSPSAAIATFACSSCRPPASFCFGKELDAARLWTLACRRGSTVAP